MTNDFSVIYDKFRQLMAQGEPDLVRAATMIARLEYPDVDYQHSVEVLDRLAAEVRERLSPVAALEERIAIINRYLFNEQGYRGNEGNYYDPCNSCLNAVLERKLGIPITLSILYIEMASRLGLSIDGISFPGHFLVGIRYEQGILVLDPFNRGEVLGETELRRLLAEAQGQQEADTADLSDLLIPASRKEILIRLLRNLKKIYVERRETDKAIAAMSLILIADPNAAGEMRDRGLLYREIEAFRAALNDLSGYLKLKPNAEDDEIVRHLVVELRAINARFN